MSKALVYWENYQIKSNNLTDFYIETKARTSFYPKCIDKLTKWNAEDCSINLKNPLVKRRIFLWGDSQSFALFPMIERYSELDPSISGTLFSNNGIPSLINVQGYEDSKKLFIDTVATSKKEKPNQKITVVLMSHWLKYVGLRGIGRGIQAKDIKNSEECCTDYFDDNQTYAGSLKILENRMVQTVKKLLSSGVDDIVIIAPYPQFPHDIVKCHVLKNINSCFVSRNEFELYRKDTLDAINRVALSFNKVKVLDPARYLCDEKTCSEFIMVNNQIKPIVFDDNHPSVYASRLLGDKTINFVQ